MERILKYLLCLSFIFVLAGCDGLNSLLGNDDEDDYKTIDIGTLGLNSGVDDGYDSSYPSRNFVYRNQDNSKGLYIYFFYPSNPGITKPTSGTYTVVEDSNFNAPGKVTLEYEEDGSAVYYYGTSGSITISNDSMTITLSDVLCKEMNDADDTETGTIVKFTGSTTVASFN